MRLILCVFILEMIRLGLLILVFFLVRMWGEIFVIIIMVMIVFMVIIVEIIIVVMEIVMIMVVIIMVVMVVVWDLVKFIIGRGGSFGCCFGMFVSLWLVGNWGSRLGRCSGCIGFCFVEIVGNVDINLFLWVWDGVVGILLVFVSGIGGVVGDIGVVGSIVVSRWDVLVMVVC